jgi:uncharacterized protein
MPFQRRMQRLPLRDIQLTDRFWTGWQKTLRDVTIDAEYKQLVETQRLQNFKNAAAKNGEFVGLKFNDSDVYKWCEAAAYALAAGPHKQTEQQLEEITSLIEAAQEADGYLNTFFQLRHPHLKWRNLLTMHEMYCAGHLIEAGVAVFEVLGDRRLLEVGRRFADHILSIFGPDKRHGYCGHQEIELALLRLAKATDEPRYRDAAKWMIEERGANPSPIGAELDDPEAMSLSLWANDMLRKQGVYDGEYCQDHAPIREHTQVVGHAVRAMYFYIAASELAEGDEALQQAIKRTWENLTGRRMYITGGIGPSASNEGFTADYDLPNLTAYAETCAAVGLVFWGQELLEMTGNSEYADIAERALYNGVMSGISMSGDLFFYTNPLESRGSHKRVPWFDCACCPPNIARLIGSLGWYVASTSADAFWVHIPAGFNATTNFRGTKVKVTCTSDYPWSGKLTIRVDPEQPVEFELRLRIPDWAEEVDTDLPGLETPSQWQDGYAVFSKLWQPGDTLTIDLGMEPKWVECNPKVRDNLGRVALTSGPLVYCAEEHDLGYAPQLFVADTEAPFVVAESDGLTTISVEGFADKEEFVDGLYAGEGNLETSEAVAKFVPYFSWCNRGPNSMQVWVRRA